MSITEDKFLKGVFSKDKRPLTGWEQKLFDFLEKEGRDSRLALKRQTLLKKFSEEGIYNKDEISRDVRQVEIERIKHRDKTERGILFENIFETYLSKAFRGMDSKKTEDYDDFFNHTDFVLSGKDDNSKDFFLGIDTATSDNKERLEKKLATIYKDLENGNLGKVKYFESKKGLGTNGKLGSLEFIPRVVILFNSQELSDFSEDLVDVIDKKKDLEEVINKQDSVLKIFEDIKDQLEEMQVYIENNKINFKNNVRTNTEKMHQAISLVLKKIETLIAEVRNKKTPADETSRGEIRQKRRVIIR